MHVLFQLAVCVCLIILAGGSIHYVHDNPSFGGGFLLVVIWGIYAFLVDNSDVFQFGKNKNSKSDDATSGERITHLERRLADIQEIVITIDEKLSRAEKQADAPVENGEKIQ